MHGVLLLCTYVQCTPYVVLNLLACSTWQGKKKQISASGTNADLQPTLYGVQNKNLLYIINSIDSYLVNPLAQSRTE